MRYIRIAEVIKYGWIQSGNYSKENSLNRLIVFKDILYSYFKYRIWSNQYIKESFFLLSKEQREIIGKKYKEQNTYIDGWYDEYYSNIRFLNKYGNFKNEGSLLTRKKRQLAYSSHFHAGEGFYVEYGVSMTKQHYSDSELVIGKKVHLGREIDLDYTGGLIIGNGVSILEGVKILTHEHDIFYQKEENELIPYSNRAFKSRLIIKDNARIGTRAIIMPGVEEIGECSIVSAGSVVKKKVPDYVIVAGNPAEIIAKIPKRIKMVKTYKNL